MATKDVGYGLIALIYLILMYVKASAVSSGSFSRRRTKGRRESPPSWTTSPATSITSFSREEALSDLTPAHKQQPLRHLRRQESCLGNDKSSHMRNASNRSMGSDASLITSDAPRTSPRDAARLRNSYATSRWCGGFKGAERSSAIIHVHQCQLALPCLSRWAPSVHYPDKLPEVQVQTCSPPSHCTGGHERRPSFRDRMRHGR
ncbi:hypothetical protein F5Y17DRAFT_461167 [Xylariaceae sp. FL0594]|nr:hypothetical protein F5Y17DRAFT_461167 [Xylariaceae sp. FL0594]